ncbi:hypothetical protein, partial [Microcoleus sp. MON2_D5]|uniref:hypothetical protein n=1 Tax=Microcoleus sp. MON2_D5 TaxID=2818833 RepID=UPI002FD5CA05
LLSTRYAGCNPYPVYFIDLFVTLPGLAEVKLNLFFLRKSSKKEASIAPKFEKNQRFETA